jgi:putative transposase
MPTDWLIMSRLPHIQVDGHIYYVTTVIYGRLPIFTSPGFIIPLFDSLNYYRYQYELCLLGYVIMPDHLHLLIWPQGERSLSEFMRDFKKFTAVRLIRQARVEKRQAWLDAFERAGQETGRSNNKVWQDDYWDKLVYTDKFIRNKLNYIHRNPCRAGLVDDPGDYPYSSYRNYLCGDDTLIEIDKEWK